MTVIPVLRNTPEESLDLKPVRAGRTGITPGCGRRSRNNDGMRLKPGRRAEQKPHCFTA